MSNQPEQTTPSSDATETTAVATPTPSEAPAVEAPDSPVAPAPGTGPATQPEEGDQPTPPQGTPTPESAATPATGEPSPQQTPQPAATTEHAGADEADAGDGPAPTEAAAPAGTTDQPAGQVPADQGDPSSQQPEATPGSQGAAPGPRPGAPSPAALAGVRPAVTVTPAPSAQASEAAMAFGRADEDGTVYVRTPDGERKVGQYPGANERDAIAYFARKYDEMMASAEVLYHRVTQGSTSAKESAADLAALRQHVGEADVVGDLPALHAKIADIATAVEARRQVEATERAAAREQAREEREKIVAEVEKIAGQDPAKTQWKSSGARIRELLDEWKNHQRSSAKLDRESENAMWQRFSAARNTFDKNRRSYFSELESTQGEAKAAKEKLVAEAERLATSTDWAPTAGAFKRLMDSWRQAGRAGRKDDDALWARFKAAQDAFFHAKDEQAAAEDESFRGNLAVKEELLKEAEALLPVKDLDSTKARLRTIQDKWEAAGKVPRADMGRIEGALRRVEQAVRDAEDARWKKSNPEVQHRVSAFAEQLQRGVAQAQSDLEAAEATGDTRKIKAAQEALAAREQWLKAALAAGS